MYVCTNTFIYLYIPTYIYIYMYVCIYVCIYKYIYTYVCMYVYIYIYCHPQTDCFVLSELFNVARHVGRSKPGSKPIQLYVRQSLRLLG